MTLLRAIGTSLTRGILSLIVLLFFQFFTQVPPFSPSFVRVTTYKHLARTLFSAPDRRSLCSSNMGATFERIVASPPLVIAFRGHQLDKVMRQHRISKTDLNSALRKYGIWNIKEVECVIIGELRWWSVPYGSGKSCRREYPFMTL